jgi:hypothetical protein
MSLTVGSVPNLRIWYTYKHEARFGQSRFAPNEFVAVNKEGTLAAIGIQTESLNGWDVCVLRTPDHMDAHTRLFIETLKNNLSMECAFTQQNFHSVIEHSIPRSLYGFQFSGGSARSYKKITSCRLGFQIRLDRDYCFAFTVQDLRPREFIKKIHDSAQLVESFTSSSFHEAVCFLRDLDLKWTPAINESYHPFALWATMQNIMCLKHFIEDFHNYKALFEEFPRILNIAGEEYSRWVNGLQLMGNHTFRGVSIVQRKNHFRIMFAGQYFGHVLFEQLAQGSPKQIVALLLFYMRIIGKENQFYSMITRKALLK